MTVRLPAHVGRQVGPLAGHLRRDLHLGVEVPDAPLRLVAHPLAVVAHVSRKARRALPLRPRRPLPLAALRIHRRSPGELRRDLDHRLVDQHRHGVEVAGVRLQPQALRLQGDRAAAGERVVEGGQDVAVEQLLRARMVGVLGAGAAPRLPDFVARLLQHRLVGGVLPEHELLNDAEEPLALLLLGALGAEQVGQADGSSTICENSTARAAASGRRAHHRCSVLGCPCRIDFSREAALLIASRGRETSMSFLRASTVGASCVTTATASIMRGVACRPRSPDSRLQLRDRLAFASIRPLARSLTTGVRSGVGDHGGRRAGDHEFDVAALPAP